MEMAEYRPPISDLRGCQYRSFLVGRCDVRHSHITKDVGIQEDKLGHMRDVLHSEVWVDPFPSVIQHRRPDTCPFDAVVCRHATSAKLSYMLRGSRSLFLRLLADSAYDACNSPNYKPPGS